MKNTYKIIKKKTKLIYEKYYLPVEALVNFPLPLPGSKFEHFNSIVYCR